MLTSQSTRTMQIKNQVQLVKAWCTCKKLTNFSALCQNVHVFQWGGNKRIIRKRDQDLDHNDTNENIERKYTIS